MAKRYIYAVKIIHEREIFICYRLYADFFRLIGVFVSECTLKDLLSGKDYDIIIIDKEQVTNEEIEEHLSRYDWNWSLRIEISRENIEKYLGDDLLPDQSLQEIVDRSIHQEKDQTLIEQTSLGKLWKYLYQEMIGKIMSSKLQLSETERKDWDVLSDLFIKYYLIRDRNFYLFSNEDDNRFFEISQRDYIRCFNDLNKYYKEQLDHSPYIEYARLYLASYANRASVLLNYEMVVSESKLLKAINKRIYALHSPEVGYRIGNFATLGGLVAGRTSEGVGLAPGLFDLAVRDAGEEEYSTYIYIQYGLYHLQRHHHDLALELFDKAVEIMQTDYRAKYYRAMIHRRQNNNVEQFEADLRSVVSILHSKEKRNSLDVKEYQYLFNSFMFLGDYYYDTFDKRSAWYYYDLALALYGQLEDNISGRSFNNVYKLIFLKDYKDALQLTKECYKKEAQSIMDRLRSI